MAYDSKAVKIKKEVKRVAATILDPHRRGAFIRAYVKVAESASYVRSARNKGNKDSAE